MITKLFEVFLPNIFEKYCVFHKIEQEYSKFKITWQKNAKFHDIIFLQLLFLLR